MKININDFLTINTQKNGRVFVSHDINQEANIYKFLRELGYRKARLNNKKIYFRRNGTDIVAVSLLDIKFTFIKMFESSDLINIPSDMEHQAIINWYCLKQPIKENGLFDYILEDSLTDVDVHNYKLQRDFNYKHKFGIQQLFSKFAEWSFDNTIDIAGSFSDNAPLYYKYIGDKKYIVFNHYNSQDNTNDGFDCWVSTYENIKHIGNRKPISNQNLRLSFLLERDYHLISKYLNNSYIVEV